jgi:4-amino-4-deoxy-L-arabinose transferase-like glycosyltransferase
MGGGSRFAVESAVAGPRAPTPSTPLTGSTPSAPNVGYDRVGDVDPARRDTKIRRALLLILTGAFALRLIVFLFALQDSSRFYSPDGREYWALGRHFGNAFGGNTHSAYFDLGLKRTPGYPAVIAAITSVTGNRESVVAFAQVLMGVATVALLYLLVRELCGVRAALIASALLAIDPISVIMPSYLQPETLFTLLLVAGTLLLLNGLRARSWILMAAAGLSFGASALVRPVALYIWIVLIPLVWLLSAPRAWRRRLLNSGIVMLAFLVPVGGWIVRNERTTGVAVLSTIEGRDLLRFRASHALAFDRGISVTKARQDLIAKVDAETKGDNSAEYNRTETAEALRTLAGHPIGTAVSSAKGLAHLLIGPGRAELFRVIGLKHPNRLGGLRTLVFAIETLILFGLLVGAACGTVLAIARRNWRVLAIGGGFAGYLVLIASSGAAYSRYRAPASPYLALLAGFAGAWLLTEIARRRTPTSPSRALSTEPPNPVPPSTQTAE